MIEFKDVKKSFDGFFALNGLSLQIDRGSVFGLVGPNGAGKTTAIRHLTGIYKQDSGEVLVDGEPVFENTKIKSKMAYIPDDIFYFPMASTKDMMQFYRDIYPGFDMQRFEKLSAAFDLDINQPIRKISRGMRKQSAFWIAISMRPDILVLDEPVDGLDPVMRRRIWGVIMQDVAENGTTVLVSSHNLRELEDVCDSVGIMNKGGLLLERSLSELQENVAKIHVAFPEGRGIPEGIEIINESGQGKLKTLIVRGNISETEAKLKAAEPLFIDVVPLTLEEIFIYELGGANYEVKDIIL